MKVATSDGSRVRRVEGERIVSLPLPTPEVDPGAQRREQHRVSATVQDVGDHASDDIESGDIGSGGRLGPDLRGCVDLPGELSVTISIGDTYRIVSAWPSIGRRFRRERS